MVLPPVDYWHSVEPLPDSFWTKSLELMPLANADAIAQQLPPQRERVGYIGYAQQRARDLGIPSENINPKAVLNYRISTVRSKPAMSWPACAKRRRRR